MTELQFYIGENRRHLKNNQRVVYDNDALEHNITRCQNNIELFERTMSREDDNIASLRNMIDVLTSDLDRPKEIWFDAKTGLVVNKGSNV
jgi:hypothetical protein